MKIALCISLFALLQLLTTANGASRQLMEPHTRVVRDTRIMNGTLATQGQFPYQACINILNFNNSGTTGLCSGMIISTTKILTAAHCLYGSEDIDVIVGTLRFEDTNSVGYYKVRSTGRIRHESFDPVTLNNDIGMLTIPALTFGANIAPILLPRRSDGDLSLQGKNAIVSGWGTQGPGTDRSEDLLWVQVKIVDDVYCSLSYGDLAYIPTTNVCITTVNGTEGACNGDSGGPLAHTKLDSETVAVGIVSYAATAGCSSGYPEVFTRVSAYLDWIASNGGPVVRP